MKRTLRATAVGAATVVLLSACGGLTNSDDTAASGQKGVVTTDGCTDPAAATKVIKDEVKIGWAVPLSGPYAGVWDLINAGFAARMKQFNADGGANGVKVKFFTTDSKLNPEVAKAMGNQMIQKDGADVISTTGTAQVATMVDDAAAACVPMLAATSSSPIYKNAEKYPWATMYLPTVTLEADIIVKATQREFPDGAKVAIAYSPSETGSIYVDAYEQAVMGTNVKIVKTANVVDPNAAATTLKASGADVLYSGTSAQECLALTKAIGRIGWKPGAVFQNATCADVSLYEPAGSAADGQQVFKYEMLPALAEFKDDPAIVTYLADAKAQGLKDPMSNWSVTGWSIGEVTANALTKAAESKDGLSRLSIMQAAQDQDFHPATVIPGIDYKASAGGFNGMQAFSWSAAKKQFVPNGAPVLVD